jgi:hypothetical protein
VCLDVWVEPSAHIQRVSGLFCSRNLWKAAYVFHPEGSIEAEAWVTERLPWLLCGDAGQVIASIRRTATCRGLTAAARKPADTCANYLEHYKAYTHYDAYLQAGLPIATGVIEGASRHVIRDRMAITGAPVEPGRRRGHPPAALAARQWRPGKLLAAS